MSEINTNGADLLDALNESQRKAVEYCDGPSLVIAGAGSGKTRVLTYKIAYLLEQGYEPWSILALTFTNKAAREMKERIARLLGDDRVRYLWMGTFHSVFLRILYYEHETIGFNSNFTVYDAADSKSLLRAIIKEMGLDDKLYKDSTVQTQISNAKNQLITADAYVANPTNLQADARARMLEIGRIYKRYADRCRQANAMDFDDLLLYTYILFETHPEIRAKYAERFRYILVDEYQDTNYAQHVVVQQLAESHRRVCVVGDDAQSIYSFRGANIDNILTFNRIYTDSVLFKLEQNYRSTQTIVDAANSLIHKNQGQIDKTVFSRLEQGEPIPVFEAYSDVEEGQIVMRKIQGLHRREQLAYSDFAILYRTNAQSRIFEEALRKTGCPYKIYGGLSFYQRKEIKDIIAYFRLTVNPNDEEAFKRIINYPTRGIGNTTVQKIVDAATAAQVSLWTVIEQPLEYGLNVSKSTYEKIERFRQMMNQFQQQALSVNAEILGTDIVRHCGIIAEIYADKTPENVSRQENVEELLNGMQEFCSSRLEEGNQNVLLADYLSEVSLLSDVDSDKSDDREKVTLMTIHSAKGLEFNTVFVVGLEENLFPSQMSGGSLREMEEERRLFYVAVTRAKRHCFLTYAKSRLRYGKMEFGNPSRFITDIDPKYLEFNHSVRSKRRLNPFDDVELPWSQPRRFSRPASASQSSRPASAFQSSREATSRPAPRVAPVTPPPTFRPVPPPSHTVSAAPSVPSVGNLHVGSHIEHQRFGIGIVEKLEGRADEAKATVRFDHSGTKQLLLKFARFTVID